MRKTHISMVTSPYTLKQRSGGKGQGERISREKHERSAWQQSGKSQNKWRFIFKVNQTLCRNKANLLVLCWDLNTALLIYTTLVDTLWSAGLHIGFWRTRTILHSRKRPQRRPSVNTPAAAIKSAFKREMRRASHNREETDGEEKKGRGRDEQKDCL